MSKRPAYLLLYCAVLLAVASCREQDRVVDVLCESAAGRNIALNFSVSPWRAGAPLLLNVRQFAPGTILRLDPQDAPANVARGSVAYHVLPPATGYMLERIESFVATVDGMYFTVSSGDNLTLPENVIVFFEEATRQALRDPLAAINSDPQAIGALQAGPAGSRFVIVAAVWSDSHVDLWTDNVPFVAMNTLKQGREYLHPNYVCPPLTSAVDDFTRAAKRRLLFAYVAVRYDQESNAAVADTEPLELGEYSFAGI